MQTLLLLDLDGTLIDTPHYEAWRNSARQIGVTDLTREEYLINIAGRPRLEGASRLLELKKDEVFTTLNSPNSINILAEIKQIEFLRLSEHARLFDDAQRLLERIEMSQQCVRFYTASQNARSLFDAMLSKLGKFLNEEDVIIQKRGQTRVELFLYLIEEHSLAGLTLIDDSPHSVNTACSLGIPAYQIHRNGSLSTIAHPSTAVLLSLDDITIPIVNTKKTT